MNTSYKIKVKKIEKFKNSLEKRSYPIILKAFDSLYLDDDIQKSEIFQLSYTKFKINMEKALKLIRDMAIYESCDFFNNLFGWGIEIKTLVGIRDVMITNFNKKYAASKIVNISETTEKILNKVVVEAQKEGVSFKVLKDRIKESVDEMKEFRAARIARTETSISINNTSNTLAENVGMREKCWIHIGGTKTSRENHKVLNGKWVPIDELWDLGKGIKTPCPHHPSLPAGEAVNCYCLQIYR